MFERYTPVRGFFIGLFTGLLVLVVVFGAPTPIKADMAPGTDPVVQNASSIIANSAIAAAKKPGLPALNALKVWITAYASVPEETSDHPFITASGEHVRDGIVASNFLPFGTQIEIPALFGNKVFVVEDRMNEKYSTRVDIWMPTVIDAVDFGIRNATIVILPPAPNSNASGVALQ